MIDIFWLRRGGDCDFACVCGKCGVFPVEGLCTAMRRKEEDKEQEMRRKREEKRRGEQEEVDDEGDSGVEQFVRRASDGVRVGQGVQVGKQVEPGRHVFGGPV